MTIDPSHTRYEFSIVFHAALYMSRGDSQHMFNVMNVAGFSSAYRLIEFLRIHNLCDLPDWVIELRTKIYEQVMTLEEAYRTNEYALKLKDTDMFRLFWFFVENKRHFGIEDWANGIKGIGNFAEVKADTLRRMPDGSLVDTTE